MRTRRTSEQVLVVALLLSGACRDKATPTQPTAAPTTAWVDHRAADGSYVARFFAAPKVEEKDDGVQPSGMVLHTKSASAADDTRLFSVAKLEIAKVKTYDCEAGLEGMIKSSLTSMGCAPDDDHALRIDGRVAHDVSFSCTKNPARGKMRVVCEPKDLANGRVDAYSVMALYQNELFDADEAKSFIESFRIL